MLQQLQQQYQQYSVHASIYMCLCTWICWSKLSISNWYVQLLEILFFIILLKVRKKQLNYFSLILILIWWIYVPFCRGSVNYFVWVYELPQIWLLFSVKPIQRELEAVIYYSALYLISPCTYSSSILPTVWHMFLFLCYLSEWWSLSKHLLQRLQWPWNLLRVHHRFPGRTMPDSWWVETNL